MWRLLVLSALAALTLGHDVPTTGIFGGGLADVAEPRLAATAIRIYQLEKRLGKIRAKIEDDKKHDPASIFNELKARTDSVEGNGCPARDFQCGGHDRECISDLFVCDGHKDCHNGHDESDDVCSTGPAKAGNVFVGYTTWTSCQVKDDHQTSISITSTRRSKFFTARVRVTANVAADLEDKDHHHTIVSHPAHGYYNFGTRKLVLFPDEGAFKHLAVVCEFNHGDDIRAECRLGFVASKNECAHAFLHLET